MRRRCNFFFIYLAGPQSDVDRPSKSIIAQVTSERGGEHAEEALILEYEHLKLLLIFERRALLLHAEEELLLEYEADAIRLAQLTLARGGDDRG